MEVGKLSNNYSSWESCLNFISNVSIHSSDEAFA